MPRARVHSLVTLLSQRPRKRPLPAACWPSWPRPDSETSPSGRQTRRYLPPGSPAKVVRNKNKIGVYNTIESQTPSSESYYILNANDQDDEGNVELSQKT